jgi:hypothetical protein
MRKRLIDCKLQRMKNGRYRVLVTRNAWRRMNPLFPKELLEPMTSEERIQYAKTLAAYAPLVLPLLEL